MHRTHLAGLLAMACTVALAAPAQAAGDDRMIVPMTGTVTQRAFDGSCGDPSHEGYDIAAALGTKVFAAAAGTAYIRSDPNGFGPNYVFVQHSGGWDTIYGHTEKVLVADGAHVVRGQAIALEGDLGHSSGPHLHFQIDHGQPYTGLALGARSFPCGATVRAKTLLHRHFKGL